MKKTKKYSVILEESIVRAALKSTGRNFTDTVRQGLRLLAASGVYKSLLEMRGSQDLELDVKTLRKSKRDLR